MCVCVTGLCFAIIFVVSGLFVTLLQCQIIDSIKKKTFSIHFKFRNVESLNFLASFFSLPSSRFWWPEGLWRFIILIMHCHMAQCSNLPSVVRLDTARPCPANRSWWNCFHNRFRVINKCPLHNLQPCSEVKSTVRHIPLVFSQECPS